MYAATITGIGQDSHRFVTSPTTKSLILGGVAIPDCPPLAGNSDADVIIHALCNALSSITCQPFLGPITDLLCKQGITDSGEYLTQQLAEADLAIEHIAISVEAARPQLLPWIPAIRQRMAELAKITPAQIGITATSGEGLSAYGKGEGIMASVIVSAKRGEAQSPMLPMLALTSCPDTTTAGALANMLVTHKLAACVQQLPIHATYSWQGKICTAGEILLLIKTCCGKYPQLAASIQAEHPYDTPQLVALPIDKGLPAYLQWLVAHTSDD